MYTNIQMDQHQMSTNGMSTIKYILFIFNFFFAISGLGILIAGALVLADLNELQYFLEGRISAPAIVLIVIGVVIFLVASLGCYGAIKENSNLLIIYAVLLAIIFLIELAVGIAACIYKSDFQMVLEDFMKKSLSSSKEVDLYAWDSVQSKLQCCGVNTFSDWIDLGKANKIRPSCCIPFSTNNVTDCSTLPINYHDKYYQVGCLAQIKDRIDSQANILIAVGLSVAFIQIIGICLARWLASAIRRQNDK